MFMSCFSTAEWMGMYVYVVFLDCSVACLSIVT